MTAGWSIETHLRKYYAACRHSRKKTTTRQHTSKISAVSNNFFQADQQALTDQDQKACVGSLWPVEAPSTRPCQAVSGPSTASRGPGHEATQKDYSHHGVEVVHGQCTHHWKIAPSYWSRMVHTKYVRRGMTKTSKMNGPSGNGAEHIKSWKQLQLCAQCQASLSSTFFSLFSQFFSWNLGSQD